MGLGDYLGLLQPLDGVLHVPACLLQQGGHEQCRGGPVQQPQHRNHVAVGHHQVGEPGVPGHGEALPQDVPEGHAGAGEGGFGSPGGLWRPG